MAACIMILQKAKRKYKWIKLRAETRDLSLRHDGSFILQKCMVRPSYQSTSGTEYAISHNPREVRKHFRTRFLSRVSNQYRLAPTCQ